MESKIIWVSIKDKLPEQFLDVLICTSDGDIKIAQCDYFLEDKIYFQNMDSGLFIKDVKYWALFPFPPFKKGINDEKKIS
jgi:hypothetical protein